MLYALIIISLLPFLIAAYLLISVSRLRLSNIIFSLICLLCAAWVTLVVLSDTISKGSTVFDIATMVVGDFISALFLYFTYTLAKVFSRAKIAVLIMSFTVVLVQAICLIIVPGYVGYRLAAGEGYMFSPGAGYLVHNIITFGNFYYSIIILRKLSKYHDGLRNYELIYKGALFAVSINLLAELANKLILVNIPNGAVYYDLICSFGLMISAVLVCYSLLRYDLFDVSYLVARTITYTACVLLISLFCGLVIYWPINTFMLDGEVRLVLIVAIICISSISFQYAKQFFDTVTVNIFYKEKYNKDILLEKLSALYSTAKIQSEIIDDYCRLLIDHLKIETCIVEVVESEKMESILKEELGTTISPNVFGNAVGARFLYQNNTNLLITLEVNENYQVVIIFKDRISNIKFSEEDGRFLAVASEGLANVLSKIFYLETIRKLNGELEHRVLAATRDLIARNKELGELSNSKDELLAVVMHQLVPQLSAMRGILELELNSGGMNIETGGILVNSSNRMLKVVSEILTYEKLSNGGFVLSYELVNIREVIEEIICESTNDLRKKNLKIIKKISTVKLHADKLLLTELLYNLINNAIKYSAEKTEISIQVCKKEIIISNQGVTTDKHEAIKVFNKFYRGKKAILLQPNGSGLGLYIAKMISQSHNYQLIFSTKQGSTVVKIIF